MISANISWWIFFPHYSLSLSHTFFGNVSINFFGRTKIQSVSFSFYALNLAGTNLANVLTNETAWIRLEVKFRVRVPSLNAWIWFDLVWFPRLIILINWFPSWATLTQTILLSDVCTIVSEKYILFALASAIVIECAVHAIYSYCAHVLKFVWNFWHFFHLFFSGAARVGGIFVCRTLSPLCQYIELIFAPIQIMISRTTSDYIEVMIVLCIFPNVGFIRLLFCFVYHFVRLVFFLFFKKKNPYFFSLY